MNNYQDKIDSFRDSLGQQASAFDSASENAKRQIQSALLDKVGKHAEYMSQVGGVIAGGSAGVHGGIKATKKVNEIYNNYKSKARSKISGEQPNEFSTPKNASVDKDISLNEAKATETDAKPITSNVFEDRTTLDQVAGDLKKVGTDTPDTKAPAQAPAQTDAQKQADFDKSTDKMDETNPIGQSTEDRLTSEGGGLTKSSDGSLRAGQEAPPVEDTLKDSSDLGDLAGKGADSLITQTTEKVGSAVAKSGAMDIAEGVGGALAEGVPVVGELVGLGMLVHGLLQAHKQKQEADANPEASAPVAQSKMDSGGFDPKALFGDSSGGVGAMV
tara:strand:+ start:70 stop:1059 length:990 start_codon:yes stop_codon:yes gene_type:complete